MKAKRHWIEVRIAKDAAMDPLTRDSSALRAAIAAHLATQGINLVHSWPSGDKWSAMMEWPDVGQTQKHVTGIGTDRITAVCDGLERMGFGGLRFRLFVSAYCLDLLVRAVR